MKPFSLLLSCHFLLGTLAGVGASSGIPPGSILLPANSSRWSSPNNTFSLGFISDSRSPSLFLAAITYNGGVPIWSAGGSVDSGGSLLFQPDGNLRLFNGSGAVVWESGTANRGIAAATLDESGNLKLTGRSGFAVWQTFDNPTDTIVESQNFTFGEVLRSGPFSFTVLKTGNLTLVWNDSITYYNNGLNSSFESNKTLDAPSLMLQKNGILTLLDNKLPSSVVVAYSSDYGESGDKLRFLRLDKDGNFRAYIVPRGSAMAEDRWSAVSDQCMVFGWCGDMGICSYNESSPVCGCPSENFDPVDPNDFTQGCKRKMEIQDCHGSSTMLEMENTLFLTYPPQLSTEQFFVGISACKLNCLSGGSCAASTSLSDGSGLCHIKVSNFVSGYHSPSLSSTSFVKVCAPASPYSARSVAHGSKTVSSKPKAWVLAVVVLAAISAILIIEGGLWLFFRRKNLIFGPSPAQYAFLEYASAAPVQFSYNELQRSTKCFKEKLGSGGFGSVYKGVLPNGTAVAVKQLEGNEQGEKQFRVEVAAISSTHHLNLVRLIGFCSEGRHRLLVYEFLKNGSLDRFLFSGDSAALSWEARFKIAVATARAIAYLHGECRDCIVHCDIKPENILLDDNYDAKVSDFGLAKLVNVPEQRRRTFSSLRGTRGYLGPERLGNSPVTPTADVYSYGMVLLEIVAGRRNFDVSEETGGRMFSVWAYEEYSEGRMRSIIDRKLHESAELNMAQVERSVRVSFCCIQEQPLKRPSMCKVVQMLEGIVEIPIPKATDGASRSSSR